MRPNALELKNQKDWEILVSDIEKSGLSAISFLPQKARGFSAPEFFCFLTKNAAYIWKNNGKLPKFPKGFGKTLKETFTLDTKSFLRLARNSGLTLADAAPRDIGIMAWLLDPEKKNYEIETLAKTYLYESLPETGTTEYDLIARANTILKLAPIFISRLKQARLTDVFENIERPLTPILLDMELTGILLDIEKLEAVGKELEKRLEALSKEIFSATGQSFNLASPQQLRHVLFRKMGLRTAGLAKTPAGEISVDAESLAKLKRAHPVIEKIINWREMAKLKTGYTDTLPKLVDAKTQRVHTTFLQTGTATGRLASENPNLQNIPKRGEFGLKIRSAFKAAKGYSLVSFDYSQIELRIVASLSEDKTMMEAFRKGEDIHRATAAAIYQKSFADVTPDERFHAKALNFGIIYGMGPRAFAESAGITLEEAQNFIDKYFSDFDGVARYIERLREFARENGYAETPTGRKRLLPNIASPSSWERSQAERIAVNMPIQGYAADIIKKAMIAIAAELKKRKWENKARLLLQVHDELLFEIESGIIKDAAPLIRDIMTRVAELNVPIIVDVSIGPNWGGLTPKPIK